MVVDEAPNADLVFHALADATRRDILAVATQEELSVSGLARRYPMSVTAVQKHVAVLEKAHLVTRRRHGREQLVRAVPDGLAAARNALDQLTSLWRGRLDRMAALLDNPDTGGTR